MPMGYNFNAIFSFFGKYTTFILNLEQKKKKHELLSSTQFHNFVFSKNFHTIIQPLSQNIFNSQSIETTLHSVNI